MAHQLGAKYDIVINGGGIVGFTLLNLILKSPHLNKAKVLLIEQAKRPSTFAQEPRINEKLIEPEIETFGGNNFSNRVSSITLKSKRAYKRLGVWDTVRPFAKNVRKIHVWNYDYNHKIDFQQDLSYSGDECREESDVMFSTLENSRLSNSLLENIVEKLGRDETIAWSSRLDRLGESPKSGLVDVNLTNEKSETHTISAPLILGCDGYKSKVRELTNINYREIDLKKTAVVGTVKMSKQPLNNNNDIAYQKFSADKDTVAAILPLDNEYSSFVISAPTDYATFLKDCNEETFVQEFNHLLSNDEVAANVFLKGLHELSNSVYDNMKAMLQLIGPRLGLSDCYIDLSGGIDAKPSIDHVAKNSRAAFPLLFGTTSPRMITPLPGLDRIQVALLGDSSHRLHPLAGQGLNLGIQDAIELVKQLESIAKSGERIFEDNQLLSKALKRYELKRQAYIIPMSASIFAMQNLFKLAPSRAVSSVNQCQPVKTLSVRIANGC